MANSWITALKKWNEKKGGAWCVPKKGTKDYDEVRALMGERKAPAREKKKREKKEVNVVKELEKTSLSIKKLTNMADIKRQLKGVKRFNEFSKVNKKYREEYKRLQKELKDKTRAVNEKDARKGLSKRETDKVTKVVDRLRETEMRNDDILSHLEKVQKRLLRREEKLLKAKGGKLEDEEEKKNK